MAEDDFTLDLEKGDPERADRITEGSATTKRSRRVSNSGSTRRKSSSKTSSQRTDSEMVGRLSEAFTRIADQLEVRDDTELAEALREDSEKISRGIVSVTRTVKFLRQPLAIFVGFIEPVLAFWRVGSILGRRFIARRQRLMAQHEMEQQQAQQVTPDDAYSGAVS